MGFLVDVHADSNVEVTLVLPAYNESERIEQAVSKAINELKTIASSYEVIIAEDGSTDGTDSIANRLTHVFDSVIHLHSDKRLGRGEALKRAFKESHGQILSFIDVDMSTDIKHLKLLIEAISDGFDFSTGSRMHPESTVSRTWMRQLLSQTYNAFIRLLFKTGISDHQCGFKAFKKTSLLEIIDDVEDNHWFWDTEILVLGIRKGYKIKEIPITWTAGKGTKVKLLSDSLKMAFKAILLWWKLRDYPIIHGVLTSN